MRIIKFLLLIFPTFFLLAVPVFADTQSELISRVDSDTKVSNAFMEKLEAAGNNPEAALGVFESESSQIISHYKESESLYLSYIETADDEELKTILKSLSLAVAGLSDSLKASENAINNRDISSFDRAAADYDNNVGKLNEQIDKLESYYGVSDDLPTLAAAFGVSFVISFILFVISRGNPILPAEKLRNEFEFALFRSSLWPFFGAAISLGWYLMTPPGGTYYFLWGLIVFGYFQFFRGLYDYVRYSRPAINLAKKEQQQHLESFLKSN